MIPFIFDLFIDFPIIPFTFNPFIDFSVWIIEVDGLLVHPFDKHPQGNGTLQNQGLTSQDWMLWIQRILAQKALKSTQASEAGLSGNFLDKVKKQAEAIPLNPILERLYPVLNRNGMSYREHVVQREVQEFERIKLEMDSASEKLWDCVQNLFEDVNSPEDCINLSICQMCPGGSVIRGRLEDLWAEYQETIYPNRLDIFERATSHLELPEMHHYLSSKKRCEFKKLVELEDFLKQKNCLGIAIYLVFYTPSIQSLQINLMCIRPALLVPVDDFRMPGSNSFNSSVMTCIER